MAEKYESIGYDELLTYAVYQLEKAGIEITFERIVAECFRLFPGRFHLRGYRDWPDSARVNKSWLRCRSDKGLLVGKVREGFSLTSKGKKVAQRVEAELGGKRPIASRRRSEVDMATKEGSLLHELLKSPAFKQFAESGSVDGLSEFDFRDALICTMDTPAAVLRSNLHQFEDAAGALKDDRVMDFLAKARERFEVILGGLDASKVGGMMRRKSKKGR